MIPYEELVAALSRWRARRGLPTGLGDTLGEAPVPVASYTRTAYEPPVADHSADDVVELSGGDLGEGSIDDPLADGPPPYSQEISLGEPLDDGDDLGHGHASLEARDVEDYGGTAPEETRPAGLAGLISSELDDVPADEPGSEPVAEARPAPAARGRSRKRRR
jgi:hypothetical protein